jgi:hypothetical protein
MSDDTRRILDLLAQGKISVDDAQRLITAVNASYTPPAAAASQSEAASQSSGPRTAATASPRYLKIAVHKPAIDQRGDKDVNIRVPIAIVRGGMRLGAIIPGLGGERLRARLREGLDVDLSKLDPAALEAMLKDLGEMNIDIDSGKAQVRITCE